ncbi:hypothetical protein JMK10_02445 [Rhodovulum sulfidophilum]|uniref:hypothetical protein n=1 Tax=Rhodovulum sulfidophilum TaxID=35806 RepID=UPI001922E44F|nr:hypothetical protein [Rhodovulum sulfidophilum]MBL3575964.1 hypothetical protein [Rhodovulum sulfidophilum]MCE8431857.1 hypothetical protein [Rhodovulum sulfidophilum]MCF4115697.1 hypothetical protein [Rhodovulum sulfidophilum]
MMDSFQNFQTQHRKQVRLCLLHLPRKAAFVFSVVSRPGAANGRYRLIVLKNSGRG